MAGKNTNTKAKKNTPTNTNVSQKSSKKEPMDSFSKLIKAATKKGYSTDVATEAVNKIWSNGVDIDNFEVAFNALTELLSKKVEEKSESTTPVTPVTPDVATPVTPKKSSSKPEDFEALNKYLIDKLTTVATYKNFNQVLSGFNQWYAVASDLDKKVFYKTGILELIFKNFFTNTHDNESQVLFKSFLEMFYHFSTEISSAFVHNIFAIKDSLSVFSVSTDDLSKKLATIIENCNKEVDSKLNRDTKMDSIINIMNSNISSLSSIILRDIPSQFKYRDTCCKIVQSAMNIINSSSPVSVDSVSIDSESLCPAPEGAESVIEKVPEIKEQYASLQSKYNSSIKPLEAQEEEELKKMNEYKTKEQALLKELEAVRSNIKQSQQSLDIYKQKKSDLTTNYKNQINKLNNGDSNLLSLIQQIEARSIIVKSLNDIVAQANSLLKLVDASVSTNFESTVESYKQNIFEQYDRYYKKEYACTAFLADRIKTIDSDIKKMTLEENKLRSLGINLSSDSIHKEINVLERKLENNKNTLSVLKINAVDNEMNFSTYLNNNIDIVKNNVDIIASIYSSIRGIGIATHISDEIQSLIADKIQDTKPEVIEINTPVPETTKTNVPTSTVNTPSKSTSTTSSNTNTTPKFTWATKKTASVPYKSIDEIQKEELNKN